MCMVYTVLSHLVDKFTATLVDMQPSDIMCMVYIVLSLFLFRTLLQLLMTENDM